MQALTPPLEDLWNVLTKLVYKEKSLDWVVAHGTCIVYNCAQTALYTVPIDLEICAKILQILYITL